MIVANVAKRRAEQRAFERHCILLPASISIPGTGVLPAEIRDFCSGGLFLSYEGRAAATAGRSPRIQPGEVIEIRCAPRIEGAERPLSFRGRVVHGRFGGIGICFVDPARDALEALQDFAAETCLDGFATRNTRGSAGPPRADAGSAAAGRPAALLGRNGFDGALAYSHELVHSTLSALRRKAEDVARELAGAFLENVRAHLQRAADATTVFDLRQAHYDAADLFAHEAAAFKRTLQEAVRTRLDQPPALPARRSDKDRAEWSASTLSLVDPVDFEDWLTFSGIARCAEMQYQEELDALVSRLEALFNVPIDRHNNPFGPASFCQAFQEALKGLELDRAVLPAIHASFKEVLCPSDDAASALGPFYDELNRHLIAHGFVPKLPAGHERSGTAGGSRAGLRASANPSASSRDVAPSAAMRARPSGVEERAAASPPEALPASAGWYDLVGDLSALKQHVRAVAPSPRSTSADRNATAPIVAGEPGQQAEPAVFYSQQELLSALSGARLSPISSSDPGSSAAGIKAELAAIVQRVRDHAAPKQLSQRESRIVDLTATLFESILGDRQVATGVAPWLRQLSLPVLKLAIRDESVFLDKSHLVRQLINAIARLEIHRDANAERQQSVMHRNVETLLAEISGSDDATPELLGRALRHVNALVRLQDHVHAQNVTEVAAACEAAIGDSGTGAQDAAAALAVGSLDDRGDIARAGDSDARDLAEWVKRVRRLRVGDWMFVEIASSPHRLQLAWIAPDFGRYVFVNAKGRNEATLTGAELARQLRDGAAVVLDHPGEPLFDRAQYAMLQELHQQLLHESTHDSLTGLINRREFERRLEQALSTVRETDARWMLCYINLNQFSLVNNALGHGAGDQLLVDVSRLLNDGLGDLGVLARVGGDEFGILFADVSEDDVLGVVARQRSAIQDYRLTVGDRTMSTSFAVGLVPVTREGTHVAALLQAAEASCRLAKCKGKSYVHIYRWDDAELTRDAEIARWAARIDDVLDNDRLHLRLQPIVCTDEPERMHHAEVLLGVCDEHGVLASTQEFVLAAEQLRRMPAIDRWVIRRAFRWMVEHPDKLALVGGLAINLSGASINEDGFADFVLREAREMNVPMEKVCFEITETVGIANLSNASEFMLTVKNAGSTFALDDFGSGLSSYGYLKNLPIDYLKIDGTFVQHIDDSPSDSAVVKSITEIGHFMGKRIIAEYVENERILALVRDVGVDLAQGYGTGKPRPLADF